MERLVRARVTQEAFEATDTIWQDDVYPRRFRFAIEAEEIGAIFDIESQG